LLDLAGEVAFVGPAFEQFRSLGGRKRFGVSERRQIVGRRFTVRGKCRGLSGRDGGIFEHRRPVAAVCSVMNDACQQRLRAKVNQGVQYQVVQVLAARHRIPLNRIAGAVQITTGRRLLQGLPTDADDVVVMLDGECSFRGLPDAELDIYWGAYLGTEHEILISGPLAERKAEIERVRSAARAAHGWIMDTYLLRKKLER